MLLILALTLSTLTLTCAEERKVIPDAGHSFPVHIGAEGHVVQGRISSQSPKGSLVPSNVIVEGEEDANTQMHLRVEIRDSIYKRPHVYHPDIKINTSDPGNPQFEHPVIEFNNSTLPYGMEFVVVHTRAFVVDEDRYIVVNDFSELEAESRIHFDVILKDKLAETNYVSNHLPFVVEIEYPKREKNPNAALFAGVLILTIVAISLLIPFVVRAKRRSKAGKPICGCGSADDSSDSDSTGSVPDYVKNRAMSIGGKDNLAMILDNGRLMNHRPSIDPHTTIQNRMLRSTSNIHFQPHYLDPHYNDVYERPDFSGVKQPPAGSVRGASASANSATAAAHQQSTAFSNSLAFGKGMSSARSSSSSTYTYPANFNANVSNVHGKRIATAAAAAAATTAVSAGNAPRDAVKGAAGFFSGGSGSGAGGNGNASGGGGGGGGGVPTLSGLDAANSEIAKRVSPLAAEEGVKVVVTSASSSSPNESFTAGEGGVYRKTSTTTTTTPLAPTPEVRLNGAHVSDVPAPRYEEVMGHNAGSATLEMRDETTSKH
ncbi:uncharacterized protein LOC101859059 [Aplysia californica]|uniref:Uncharacterized protein LOC101859059 n=1 Tax=Aplysia californica TaxID=6500 RepID=A0ABM0JBE9_APLCA|nr:uncharacterized protein LOC101859059 [Aplysia californica]